MRIASLAAVIVVSAIAAPVSAVPITWNLDATIARTNYQPLGPMAIGDSITATMVVETDTPGTPTFFANGYAYFNVFDSFSLAVNGRTLTLGPDSSDIGWTREANWMGTSNFDTVQILQMAAMLYDGEDAYQAYLWFEFADTAAFPIGSLPLEPPSLASATLRDIDLYSPVNGDPRNGAIFIAGAHIDTLTASVPEPSTLSLFALGMLGLGFVRRRRA